MKQAKRSRPGPASGDAIDSSVTAVVAAAPPSTRTAHGPQVVETLEATQARKGSAIEESPPPPVKQRAVCLEAPPARGTQGCGECIALTLADEGAAGITICGRNESNGARVKHALERRGCLAVYVRADLASPDDCAAVLAGHEKAFGRCDGLVNCAAATWRGSWDDTSVDLFDSIYHLNVRAPFLLSQGAVKMMERQGNPGAIVNIGSVHCHGGMPKLAAYATSKGALLTMTKNLAFAKRKAGIRANVIAVGWMATPAEHQTMLTE
eukprot:gene12302-2244_t